MATYDCSPPLFAGQSWATWGDNVESEDGDDDLEIKDVESVTDDSTSMKLRQEDMGLYGLCPSQDEFYLVCCEKCKQLVKPQAFKNHMLKRHGTLESSKEAGQRSSSSQQSGLRPSSSMPPTKASLKQPPRAMAARLGRNLDMKKSNTMPFVKVDRLPDKVAINKTLSVTPEREEAALPKPLLTNGTVRSLTSNPVPAPTPPPPPLASSPPVSQAVQSTTSMTSITTVAAIGAPTSVTTTTAIATSAHPVVSSSSVTSSSKKSVKERKFLPCKDREFDPDKHCGVFIVEIGKQCTRSLTCKTHALSLRRAVKGRKKPFDELLKEHRATKEAMLKAKAETTAAKVGSTAAPSHPAVAPSTAKSASIEAPLSRENTPARAVAALPKLPSPAAPRLPKSIMSKPHANPVFQRLVSGGVYSSQLTVKEEAGSVQDAAGRLSFSSDGDGDAEGEESAEKADATYLTHEPRPLAMCTFGARYNGAGYFSFSRKLDSVRGAFFNAMERHSHPPPHKKLCVESNLPKESQVPSFNSKDPYEFNMVDTTPHSAASLASNVLNSALNKTALAKQKSIKTTAPGSSKPPVKVREGSSSGARSPGYTGGAPASSVSAIPSNKRKRSGSCSSNSSSGAAPSGIAASTTTTTPTCTHSAPVSGVSNIFTTVSLTNHTGSVTGSPVTTFTFPSSMNLSSATLTQLGALSVGSKTSSSAGPKLVLTTGLDTTIINGQYLNISSSQLAELTGARVVAPMDEKSAKRSRTAGSGLKGVAAGGVKVAGGLEAYKALSSSGVLAAMPQNAVIVDGSFQGHVLASPVTLAAGQPGKTLVSIGGSYGSTCNAVSSSAMVKTDAVPQVSLCTLPNGVMSSTTGSSSRHSHALKGNHGKPSLVSSAGKLLQAAPAVSAPLSHLNMKAGTLNMAKGLGGRLTIQPMPMSVTMSLPLVHQASLGSQPGTAGHTLLVTTTAAPAGEGGGAKPSSLPNS